ncbi:MULTISPECIES: class I SAM-dependent methyltransferase [unclassified Nocardiopsis]|uniref:class I SAM-dependent methyltransferase n=1 Tax=unclassified Nocardiopsis TaxID=2649073 RepID=UPI003405A802
MTNYARMYRLGVTPWERYGPVAMVRFRSFLDRVARERGGPGRALDIGCGRGRFTPELAAQGWDVTGVDLVPAAVEAARRQGPSGVDYLVGDATDLSPDLGLFDLFVDIGCFQGFDADQRAAQGRGVTALAAPGASLLMLEFGPSVFRRMVGGVSRAEVEAAFPGWELVDVEDAPVRGLGFPMNRTAPQWYRLRYPA